MPELTLDSLKLMGPVGIVLAVVVWIWLRREAAWSEREKGWLTCVQGWSGEMQKIADTYAAKLTVMQQERLVTEHDDELSRNQQAGQYADRFAAQAAAQAEREREITRFLTDLVATNQQVIVNNTEALRALQAQMEAAFEAQRERRTIQASLDRVLSKLGLQIEGEGS